MRKYVIFISLILFLMNATVSFASQTASYYFTANCPDSRSVVASGGNLSAVINVDTGVLSAALTPAFNITTNSRNAQSLTFSASTNSLGGVQNAVFNVGATKYVILTNSSILPPLTSLTDIKSGSPTAASNPNAIAYQINDPPSTAGVLTSAYNSSNKNWDMTLTNRGTTPTSITVPAVSPLTNTYSGDDEAGSYQATITLSFN